MANLSSVVKSCIARTTGLKNFCERCLETERWNGDVVLMIVDAAFDSIGLNYFNIVVPKVMEFEENFVKNGEVISLRDLSILSHEDISDIWANKRSWKVARLIASYLDELGEKEGISDKKALRTWADKASLEGWKENRIGKIHGVGLTTYQYLRMMGGVDTSMPDKIVRRVIKKILNKAEVDMPVENDIALVKTIEKIARKTGYKSIEICWMTWLIQSEGDKIRMEKYGDVLERI